MLLAKTIREEDEMAELEKTVREAEKILEAWKPTKITFGEGSIQKVGDIVRRYSDKVLVVVGQGSLKRSGVLESATGLLEKHSIQYQVCGGVEPNPSKETVYRIAYHLLAKGFTSLLAVGGGSVMDAAKAAGILATAKEGELDDYFGVGNASKKIERILPLIVAPTTSGTGSDLTKFSVITDETIQVKKMIIDGAIVSTEAIVDPELTYSCNDHVTRVTGLDALTHLVEGYFNNVDEGIDPECNHRALVGFELVFHALPRVLENPKDKEARRMMALASTLGGSVLYFKQAGLPHLNSFSWSQAMDHGEAVAVMLPYYSAYYAPDVSEKIKNVAKRMGLKESKDMTKAFVEGLFQFYRKIHFPTTLKEYKGFSKDLVDKAIKDASQNRMKLEASPRPVSAEKSAEVLKTIIEGAYEGSIEKILKL